MHGFYTSPSLHLLPYLLEFRSNGSFPSFLVFPLFNHRFPVTVAFRYFPNLPVLFSSPKTHLLCHLERRFVTVKHNDLIHCSNSKKQIFCCNLLGIELPWRFPRFRSLRRCPKERDCGCILATGGLSNCNCIC